MSKFTVVLFLDPYGNVWETCTANCEGAENFGPRYCAKPSAVPAANLIHLFEEEAGFELFRPMTEEELSATEEWQKELESTTCKCGNYVRPEEGDVCSACWEDSELLHPSVCKGCGAINKKEVLDLCLACEIATDRASTLSDKVDAFAKDDNLHIFYSEDEWNEFK